jgi:tRNA pseudouridine65 synthase
MSLPILYEDSHLVVINKPSGLLVHRSLVDKFETQFAMQILRDQIGKYVYPVHRLDKATSGSLIFALSKESAARITEEFSNSRVTKKYLAVVRGFLENSIELDYPLTEERDRTTDSRSQLNKQAQAAMTVFQPLATVELPHFVDKYPSSRYSLIQASPKTGRKHQIRRHLHHLRHPIIGDVNYGSGKHNKFFEETFKIRRLLLACTEISFRHPFLNQDICIHAPLAADYSELLQKLGWGNHGV